MKKIILFCLVLLLVSSCSNKATINKEQTNLGYLVDAENNVVLALNTDVYMTTVQSRYRQEMTEEAQETIFRYHRLLDSYHDYLDEEGKRIVNVKYLNEHIGDGPIAADPGLIEAIELSIEMTKLTKGYFNLTIGRLVDAYEGKFLPFETTNSDPDEEVIEEALETIVPYELIEKYIVIDRDASSVSLYPYEGKMYKINLGAISKGFVLDNIDLYIDSSFLLNAGASSILAYNREDEDVAWTIASKMPDSSDLLMAYALHNRGTSTSGDDEQFYLLEDGTRRHHILNPYKGYSESFYRRVTLVSDRSAIIDALSTAIFSIGDLDEAIGMIHEAESRYGISIDYCLLGNDNGGYRMYVNEGFRSIMAKEYDNDKVEKVVVE